ncbi:hypothetical protein C5167_006062 [Papaver somniferum]|uniref:Uncharacterized protein n=1 Tax=Papaver somniferum TaxID=3469 RepID=A0A4Y7JC99_PAPSO|nr:hypothetical protein C5167_006062 [Papaver somniferum]
MKRKWKTIVVTSVVRQLIVVILCCLLVRLRWDVKWDVPNALYNDSFGLGLPMIHASMAQGQGYFKTKILQESQSVVNLYLDYLNDIHLETKEETDKEVLVLALLLQNSSNFWWCLIMIDEQLKKRASDEAVIRIAEDKQILN